MSHCKICNRPLNLPGIVASVDCGGDCLACMAEAGDPDAEQAMVDHRTYLYTRHPGGFWFRANPYLGYTDLVKFFAEVHAWVVDQFGIDVAVKVTDQQTRHFFFEDESLAMAFRMRWC